MKTFCKSAILGVAALCLAQADTLRLRDGRNVDGTFVSGNRDEIRFRSGDGGVNTYNRSDVDSVTFGAGGAYGGRGGVYDPNDNRANDNRDGYRRSDRSRNDSDVSNDRYRDDRYRDDRYRGDRYRDERTRDDRARGSDADRNRIQQSSSVASQSDYILPAGTAISVRLLDPIDSDSAHAGMSHRATLDQPIVINGRTFAPAGSDATVTVVRVQQGGKISGNEDVTLQLSSINANGRTYNLATANEDVSSSGRGKQSAEVIGGGAALGAIIGAIAGGGKGAAIGAGAGAAAGAGVQAIRGQRVKIPAETRLSFTLNQDVNL